MENMRNLFIIRYKRHGGPKEVVFDADDMAEARIIAQDWCKENNYKFGVLKSFYRDLKKEIKEIKDKKAAELVANSPGTIIEKKIKKVA